MADGAEGVPAVLTRLKDDLTVGTATPGVARAFDQRAIAALGAMDQHDIAAALTDYTRLQRGERSREAIGGRVRRNVTGPDRAVLLDLVPAMDGTHVARTFDILEGELSGVEDAIEAALGL
jgi:hypothetical protein